MQKINFELIHQYFGANPLADNPVLVFNIASPELPALALDRLYEAEQQLKKISNLFPYQSVAEADINQQDSLLVLSFAAVNFAFATLNEMRGYLLDKGAQRVGESIHFWIGFHDTETTLQAIKLAFNSLCALISGSFNQDDFLKHLEQLFKLCKLNHPDYQARILMVGAQSKGIPYLPLIPKRRYWQFGWGSASRVFMESCSNQDGMLGFKWQESKVISKLIMNSLGMPTASHVLISGIEELEGAVKRIGFPCVIKPVDGGGGIGVTANIQSFKQLVVAFQLANSVKQGLVLLEKHIEGSDHRLMVIDGKFIAAIRREPSSVVGDGTHSIQELLDQLNSQRYKNIVKSRYHKIIQNDVILRNHLATQSLKLEDIPAQGQKVTLRSNANLSTGGLCTDLTKQCHPEIKQMALILAKAFGLHTLGLDYITSDISQSPADNGGVFIELNTTPGLSACVAAGWEEEQIACMVLGEKVAKIEIDIFILTDNTIAAILNNLHRYNLSNNQGLVVEDNFLIGQLILKVPRQEPWSTVKAGLRNLDLNSMKIICSKSQILKLGLPVQYINQSFIADSIMQSLSPIWQKTIKKFSALEVHVLPEDKIISKLTIDLKLKND